MYQKAFFFVQEKSCTLQSCKQRKLLQQLFDFSVLYQKQEAAVFFSNVNICTVCVANTRSDN